MLSVKDLDTLKVGDQVRFADDSFNYEDYDLVLGMWYTVKSVHPFGGTVKIEVRGTWNIDRFDAIKKRGSIRNLPDWF